MVNCKRFKITQWSSHFLKNHFYSGNLSWILYKSSLGAVSSNPINCTFIGDNSLSKRSMSRLSIFLEKMGAEVKLTKKDFLPLHINGNVNLIPMEHIMQKASAQVKSAIILSALNLRGITKIIEKRNRAEALFKNGDKHLHFILN